MRKYRILLMVDQKLVPPDDTKDLSEAQIDDFRTEYDVLTTLRRPGHEVRVVGIGDHLTELRETIDEFRPHVVFNLLDEFSGIISYDHYVVAYLELIRQRYTGCNPRGMMLSRDKVLTKRVLATHRVATPAFRLFPFGRRYREPRRPDVPAVREVGHRGRVARYFAGVARRRHEEPARTRAIHPRADPERCAGRGIHRRPRDLRWRARQYAADDAAARGKWTSARSPTTNPHRHAQGEMGPQVPGEARHQDRQSAGSRATSSATA